MRRLNARLLGLGLAGCAILGVGLAAGLLSGVSKDLSKQKRVEFSIKPGETHRIVAYMVAGGSMRFDSDSGAGRVRYRLRLEDGHSSSLIANGVTSAKQRGELSPQHGSLYEWTWDNLSPGPVHVIFCAEGDFNILDKVDVR